MCKQTQESGQLRRTLKAPLGSNFIQKLAGRGELHFLARKSACQSLSIGKSQDDICECISQILHALCALLLIFVGSHRVEDDQSHLPTTVNLVMTRGSLGK